MIDTPSDSDRAGTHGRPKCGSIRSVRDIRRAVLPPSTVRWDENPAASATGIELTPGRR